MTYGLKANISLAHCLEQVPDKSGHWSVVSGNIVKYDVLAPRPEVLLS